MMYQWGAFQFELMTAAPQTVTRSNEYRWAGNNRIGARPSKQYLGIGADTITFDGVIFPEFSGGASLFQDYFPAQSVGIWQVEAIRAIAEKGEPQVLMRGDGFFMGLYCLEHVDETDTAMIAEGVPLKQEFKLEFSHYGRDQYARV